MAAILGKDPKEIIGKTANDLGLLKNTSDLEKLTSLIISQGYIDKFEVEKDLSVLDIMSRDTSYWRGPFYYHRRDPRLLVPKLHPSLGWTLNFANPGCYLALAALAGIIIIMTVYIK